MLVFDTSAYINGQRDHLPIATFPSVWELVAAAIEEGRIILPREVYRELEKKDDEIADWIKQHVGWVTEPSQEVQKEAGEILQHFPAGPRNAADPFILAEARIRDFTVVTYEGQTFSGVPTKRWARSMPGICKHLEIKCCTLPEALGMLGASL